MALPPPHSLALSLQQHRSSSACLFGSLCICSPSAPLACFSPLPKARVVSSLRPHTPAPSGFCLASDGHIFIRWALHSSRWGCCSRRDFPVIRAAMFDQLTESLEVAWTKLRKEDVLTRENIKDPMRDVRRALLEADVSLPVVRSFVKNVTEKAIGVGVIRGVRPDQQLIKVVNDELVKLMGGEVAEIQYAKTGPTVILMAGLQGVGKTTLCGKLALYLKKKRKMCMMVATDVYRPAAIDQLLTLGKQVSGKPIKFVGDGESMEALEPFYPDRLAGRILGMGDVLSFVEKAEEVMLKEEAEEMQKKIMEAKFDFNDFLKQTRTLARMGPMSKLVGMIPGMGKVSPQQVREAEKSLKILESMINSMTPKERGDPELLAKSPSRRRRVALGSGRSQEQVSQLVGQLFQMRVRMKNLMAMLKGGSIPGLEELEESLKGSRKPPPGTAKRRKNKAGVQKQLATVGSQRAVPKGFGSQ